MPRAAQPCTTPGCPELVPPGTSRCQACQVAQRTTQRQRRDKEAHAHYNSRGHRRFRRLVLARDRLCVLCGAVATEADHYPVDRRELQARGLDVNDPANGRGLCKSCHSRETAKHQPGGWADRALPPA